MVFPRLRSSYFYFRLCSCGLWSHGKTDSLMTWLFRAMDFGA